MEQSNSSISCGAQNSASHCEQFASFTGLPLMNALKSAISTDRRRWDIAAMPSCDRIWIANSAHFPRTLSHGASLAVPNASYRCCSGRNTPRNHHGRSGVRCETHCVIMVTHTMAAVTSSSTVFRLSFQITSTGTAVPT